MSCSFAELVTFRMPRLTGSGHSNTLLTSTEVKRTPLWISARLLRAARPIILPTARKPSAASTGGFLSDTREKYVRPLRSSATDASAA